VKRGGGTRAAGEKSPLTYAGMAESGFSRISSTIRIRERGGDSGVYRKNSYEKKERRGKGER